MDMENTLIRMVQFIKDNGKIMKNKEMEFYILRKVKNMKECFSNQNLMDMENMNF